MDIARALLLLGSLLVASSAWARDITLQTDDGTSLHASYLAPDDEARGGVVLVHDEGRCSKDWKFLAQKLQQSGLHVVSPDLRGHGDSSGSESALEESDYAAMTADVSAALDYLDRVDAGELALVGASFGANLALKVASERPDVQNLVLLSPGLNLHGITTTGPLQAYGERSLLLVVSKEDRYAAKTALVLDAQAKGPKHLEIYEGAGAGATMLNREPALEGLIVSWLLGTYNITQGEAMETTDLKVETDDEEIETSGPKLSAHE